MNNEQLDIALGARCGLAPSGSEHRRGRYFAAFATLSLSSISIIDGSNVVLRIEIELGYGDWYGMAFSQGFVWLTSPDSGKLYQIRADG